MNAGRFLSLWGLTAEDPGICRCARLGVVIVLVGLIGKHRWWKLPATIAGVGAILWLILEVLGATVFLGLS